MTVLTAPVAERLVLYGVDWRTYSRLTRIFDRPALRLTYDRGTLEIMSTSPEHERFKYLLGRLLDALTEELGIPIAAFGSMTCKRRRYQRGLEPDQCYYIANEPQVHCRDHIDLRSDPPPDLAIEVDITSSSVNRMAIYARLGVPEVWRFNGQALTFHVRQSNRTYQGQPNSQAFPFLATTDLERFLALRAQLDDNALVRQFRAWVKQKTAGTPNPPTP